QLDKRYQCFIRKLFLERLDAGSQLGRGMRKILIDHTVVVARNILKVQGCILKLLDRCKERVPLNYMPLTDRESARYIGQVVFAKHLQRDIPDMRVHIGDPLVDGILRRAITVFIYLRAVLKHQVLKRFVFLVIYQRSLRLDTLDEEPELVYIALKRREHVNVIPGNATDQGYIWLGQVELGPLIDRRGEILITFNDNKRRILCEPDHAIEFVKLGTHEVVEIAVYGLQHMHDHAGDGGFTVATANHNPHFLFRLFVNELRI